MYIQVEVFNSTPTQTRGFYANVVIPSFFSILPQSLQQDVETQKTMVRHLEKRIQQVELDSQEKVS